MDTSKQYIKMSKEAGELQALWVPKHGDYYQVYVGGIEVVCREVEDVNEGGCPAYFLTYDYDRVRVRELPLSRYTWLPKQDQLQGIVQQDKEQPHGLIIRFYIWMTIDCDLEILLNCSGSMEQLWLAFVMKAKFNKTWNGDEWE